MIAALWTNWRTDRAPLVATLAGGAAIMMGREFSTL
jgi:hypothetical protein